MSASKKRLKANLPIASDLSITYGENRKNVKEIEQRLGVTIESIESNITIIGGSARKRRTARDILMELAALSREGKPIEENTLNAIITRKMPAPEQDNQPDAAEAFNDNAEPYQGNVCFTMKNGKAIMPRNAAQEDYMRAMKTDEVVFGLGAAGTGKTYLAVAAAIEAFDAGEAKKIIITRPAVEAGEKLGFLPGSLEDKIDPYLRPIFDALYEMKDKKTINNLIANGTIEIAPLAYMRGRTLKDAYIILDEAQNTTVEQMKMFLTRKGPNSKMIINGDHTQTDLPKDEVSGLMDAIDALEPVAGEGLSITTFRAKDVVRDPMVARIVGAYEARDKAREAANTAENDDAAAPQSIDKGPK